MSLLFTLLTVCLFSASDVSAASTDNQSSYQTAFLYFLPDYQPKTDEAEDRGCVKLGYTYTRSNCAAPRILKDKCPVGNFYKTCYCAGSPTCTGSTSSSNPYPSSTGASSTNCTNCPGDKLYTWTCSASSCSAYTLSSCPSHGYCSQCCSGKYKLDSCASGYELSGGSCSCSTTCTDKVSSKPANSSYTTSSCTACGVTTTIKTGWSCNSGYTKSGDSCVEECIPLPSETGCSYGAEPCSDGCGRTRNCCKSAPADPCAGVSCPEGEFCKMGCKSYYGGCCSHVCFECKPLQYCCKIWCNSNYYEHIEPCPYASGGYICYNGDTIPYYSTPESGACLAGGF